MPKFKDSIILPDGYEINAEADLGTGGGGAAATHEYLGTNTIGSSTEAIAAGSLFLKKVTLSAGVLQSIGAYISCSSQVAGAMFGALYSDNAGSPDKLLASAAAAGAVDTLYKNQAGWYHTPLSFYIDTPGDYWIGWHAGSDAGNDYVIYLETTGGSDETLTTPTNWIKDLTGAATTSTTKDYSIRASMITQSPYEGFVGAKATREASQSISSGSATAIQWDTVKYDTNSFWSASNPERLTIPTGQDGKYLCIASAEPQGNSSGYRQIDLVRNSGSDVVVAEMSQNGSATFSGNLTATTILDLSAGDYIKATYYQNSGTALNVGFNEETFITLVKLNGSPPSTIVGLSDVNVTGETDGQVLTYDTATSKWKNADATTGALVLIETITLGSNGTITFSNIPQTYTDIIIMGKLKDTTTVNAVEMRVGTGGSVDTGTNYGYHRQQDGTAGGADTTEQSVSHAEVWIANQNVFSTVELRIPDYASTTTARNWLADSGYFDTTADARSMRAMGEWTNTTGGIDTITFYGNSLGNLAAGSQLSLYGLA